MRARMAKIRDRLIRNIIFTVVVVSFLTVKYQLL